MSKENFHKTLVKAADKMTGRQDMLAKNRKGPENEIGMDQRKAKGKFSKHHDRGGEEVDFLENSKFAEQEVENERKASDKNKKPEYKKGGNVKKYAKGGSVRGGGCEVRGKTKGRMV